jgi:tetratricopeptide (TPR) repeat protein
MATNLEPTPEQIFGWLNEFEESYLSPTSNQYIDGIDKRISQGTYADAFDLLDDLQQLTRYNGELHERAEVFFESGFAYYRMGYMNLAVDALKHAVLEFPSGKGNNHKQVVARCLLGAMQWHDDCDRNQAIIGWKRCVKELAALRLQADRENKQTKAEWYADQHAVLEAALATRVSQTISRTARSNAPASQRPSSRSQPPDRYSYLVLLVQGDIGVADRLIEYERRNAPDCDRAELIERAIERLLRSRR